MPGRIDNNSPMRRRCVMTNALMLCVTLACGCSKSREESTQDGTGIFKGPQTTSLEQGPVDMESVRRQAESLRKAGFSDAAVDANRRRVENLVRAVADAGASNGIVFEYAGLERHDVESYLVKIKRAMESSDRQELAKMVDYPFTLRKGKAGKSVVIQNANEFVRLFDDIVTPKVKAAVKAAEVENLGASWQGVKIGRGVLWFGGRCEEDASLCEPQEIRILSINPPM